MTTKHFLLGSALLVSTLLTGTAQAQQSDPDGEDHPASGSGLVNRVGSEEALGRLLMPAPVAGTRNQALVVQQGTANQLSVDQQLRGGVGPNLVQLQQVGSANFIEQQQQGSNLTQQITQRGYANEVSSRMRGQDVESDIRQQGNANKVQQDLNVNQRAYLIEQTGNRNELVQRENGPATPSGYEVRMTGNMRVIIEHGH